MEKPTRKETQDYSSECTCNLNEDKNEIIAKKILRKFGKFQVMFLTLLCLVSIWIGMSLFSFVFLNIEPELVCQTKLENNVSKQAFLILIFWTIKLKNNKQITYNTAITKYCNNECRSRFQT